VTRLVRVARRWQETERIFAFELASFDGTALPAFEPGSHIDVHLSNGLVRQYSLASQYRVENNYEIAVLDEVESRGGSRELCEIVKEGDVLKISEPRNHFALEPAEHTILLAGGIGITPILCMAEYLQSSGAEFELHYCARTSGSMAFQERIADSDISSRTSLHFDDGDAAQLLDLRLVLGVSDPGRHAYICGPTGFLEFVRGGADDLGWPSENVHFEYFTPPDDSADQTGSSFEVMLASSGLVVTIEDGVSIVEALARHGIDIPVSCEQGVCGSCLTRVLSGKIDHRDYVLSDAEREVNDQILPCCSRSLSPRLVLDL
jgi:vanillate O-demethylase ferredoxin subunit